MALYNNNVYTCFFPNSWSSASESWTKTGPNPMPAITPKGFAKLPKVVAVALSSSGNHYVANILIAFPSIGAVTHIQIVGRRINQNSSLTIIIKYRIHTPKIKAIVQTLKVKLKPNLFRMIAAGKLKMIHAKKKEVAQLLTTMALVP